MIITDFNSSWSMAIITIHGCGFGITPEAVAGGVKSIISRCLSMQNRSALGKDVTKEQMKEGAEMLMKHRGIRKWAQERAHKRETRG